MQKHKETLKKLKPTQDVIFKKYDIRSLIIQKYLSDIPLINHKKYDIRCFLIIAWTDPLLILYRDGYIRRSLKNYNLTNLDKAIVI